MFVSDILFSDNVKKASTAFYSMDLYETLYRIFLTPSRIDQIFNLFLSFYDVNNSTYFHRAIGMFARECCRVLEQEGLGVGAQGLCSLTPGPLMLLLTYPVCCNRSNRLLWGLPAATFFPRITVGHKNILRVKEMDVGIFYSKMFWNW